MPDVLQFIGTLLVGVATGILSGMFGIGGAVVSTPAVRALGASPLEAVGSTLPSILPSSISGTLRYHREGLVRTHVVLWTCVFGVPASVGGSLLSGVVPGGGHLLMLATAGLVGFTAYRTAFPNARVDIVGEEHIALWRIALIGVAAGGLSGLLGVGGGILMVPAFSAWLRIPLKETIATSLACVGVFAVPGHDHARVARPHRLGLRDPAVHRRDPRRAHRREPHDRIERPDAALLGRRGARDHRDRSTPSASSSPSSTRARPRARARANTASSIGGVSRPVNVFCWLG